MLPTSQRYKEMVYSQDYARHFVPYITIQVVDTKAMEEGSYTASSNAFYSDPEQLTDLNEAGSFDFGTLADFQFLLDGSKRLMPEDKIPEPEEDEDEDGEEGNDNEESGTETAAEEITEDEDEEPPGPQPWLPPGQYGWCSEEMSDEDGVFEQPATLTRQYPNTITTAGRTYNFDKNYDSVPADFDIEYYRQGRLISMLPVRNNQSYTVVAYVKAKDYDRAILKVLRTSKPFRRVHLVEDVPGIRLSWDRTQIVSVGLNQQVDVYCREIISTELDFSIENAAKSLNILNAEGFEEYLRKRQPVDAALAMVFPDNTEERIPLGSFKLSEWKVPKGSINAEFICYDAIDTLVLGEYIKATIHDTAVSFYDLAKDVLEDAGIEKYTIDTQLLNLYTTAPLPIATHKELLRLIAQATQSLVLPQLDGGIHIKYNSPLLVATNFVKNPAFGSDWENWDVHDECEFTSEYIHSSKQSVKIKQNGVLKQDMDNVYYGHKYYCRCYATVTEVMTGAGAYFKANGENISVNFNEMGLREDNWVLVGAIYEIPSPPEPDPDDPNPPPVPDPHLILSVENEGSPVIVDSFMAVDLTVTYGKGDEPDLDWCNENIRFFTTQLMIPRVKGIEPVDYIDYSMLIETPEITTTEPIRSVSAKIYQYKVADEETEVYSGIHVIAGTDTIEVRFNAFAKDVTVEVTPENETTGTATLLESTIYARAAILKIQASDNAVVVVKGKALSTQVTEYRVDESLDTALIPDAKSISIDNRLITNKTTAEDITGYMLYWYKQGYEYDFDWRQNPAVECMDTVVVEDDFGVNNRVLLTDKTLEYDDGYLHGNSKGVC